MGWHIFPTWQNQVHHADISARSRAPHRWSISEIPTPPPLPRASGTFTVEFPAPTQAIPPASYKPWAGDSKRSIHLRPSSSSRANCLSRSRRQIPSRWPPSSRSLRYVIHPFIGLIPLGPIHAFNLHTCRPCFDSPMTDPFPYMCFRSMGRLIHICLE